MYWKLHLEPWVEPEIRAVNGRFVLHRHNDGQGPHLDLRLEHNGCLLGWRIAGKALEDEPWATEKAPHPSAWLERDGDAIREDAGSYVWLERGDSVRTLYLRGQHEPRILRFERIDTPAPEALRSICDALAQTGADPGKAGALIRDGAQARQRAIERFCGLGRELDGDTFMEPVWCKALAGLSLTEIHEQLRAYETRFDAKYPPAPVSQPEALPEDESPGRAASAMAIARG